MRYFLPVILILVLITGCTSCNQGKEKTVVVENDQVTNEVLSENDTADVSVYERSSPPQTDAAEDLANAVVTYRNKQGHELRLEIMGQNHDHIWYYSEGEGGMQIIPVMGANDVYAMTTNEGESIGHMQFREIETESGVDLPGKIDVDVEKGKSVFRRISVMD